LKDQRYPSAKHLKSQSDVIAVNTATKQQRPNSEHLEKRLYEKIKFSTGKMKPSGVHLGKYKVTLEIMFIPEA
jgi:hypothetical protein